MFCIDLGPFAILRVERRMSSAFWAVSPVSQKRARSPGDVPVRHVVQRGGAPLAVARIA